MMYSLLTSVSMADALVAGVPIPFFSVSLSYTSFPAVSIAARREASVYSAGGFIFTSAISFKSIFIISPTLASLSSLSAHSFVIPNMISICVKPLSIVCVPFASNSIPLISVST